jgi:NAD(P)-dependent dehydrogenase (short-subunit alcohol dehydrogenase family)
MTKRLDGKVAVVTGGNNGIGFGTAKRLPQEGAKVAISGRTRKILDEAGKTIGAGVLAMEADIAKLAELDKLYTDILGKDGQNRCFVCERGHRKERAAREYVRRAVRHHSTSAESDVDGGLGQIWHTRVRFKRERCNRRHAPII